MNPLKFSIRVAKHSDLKELQDLFVNTISTICKHDYSPKQIEVWLSSIENTQKWADKLNSQYFIIAELEGKIIGYASLTNNNHLDLLYVHKDHQRQGIANTLYSEIENEVIKRKGIFLNSEVSQTAVPFFEKKGFTLLSKQKIIKNNIEICNFNMTKKLHIV